MFTPWVPDNWKKSVFTILPNENHAQALCTSTKSYRVPNVFGVPSLDVKPDTFTLKWLTKWVGRHISHVNTPSWWRSLFIPTINSTHLCCVWCLLQVSMTDLRCDSESVVMVRHRVSTQVIHDIGRGMLPQSRVFVIYWTYSCKLSKQASYVLRKYFFSCGITRSVDKKSFSVSVSLYLKQSK